MLPRRRRSVASADWCHDRRLFGSHTALAGNLAEVTWERWCWSGLVVGKWGRGGLRLVDSEKSPIVTLSAVCGAGWADRERTDEDCSSPTELVGGTSVICRKSQPSPSIAVPGVRLGRTALTQSEPTIALPWAAAPHARLALRPCCGSVSQVTASSGNGLRSGGVEPVRLKVG